MGIGTANYRDLCPDILADGSAFRCDNHRIIFIFRCWLKLVFWDLQLGLFMISAMVITLFRAGRVNNPNIVAATAYIVPLGCFFRCNPQPIFLGNGTIFSWSAVALSMAAAHLNFGAGAERVASD